MSMLPVVINAGVEMHSRKTTLASVMLGGWLEKELPVSSRWISGSVSVRAWLSVGLDPEWRVDGLSDMGTHLDNNRHYVREYRNAQRNVWLEIDDGLFCAPPARPGGAGKKRWMMMKWHCATAQLCSQGICGRENGMILMAHAQVPDVETSVLSKKRYVNNFCLSFFYVNLWHCDLVRHVYTSSWLLSLITSYFACW